MHCIATAKTVLLMTPSSSETLLTYVAPESTVASIELESNTLQNASGENWQHGDD